MMGLYEICQSGKLKEHLLSNVPRNQWSAVLGDKGLTYLHFACLGNNVDAVKMILKAGGNVNACSNKFRWERPLTVLLSASKFYPEMLKLLLAARVDLNWQDWIGHGPFDIVFGRMEWDAARILIANGMRVPRAFFGSPYARHLLNFQHHVYMCRKQVIALLRVKRAGKLWRWDKFLLREIAIAVWATRYEIKIQR